MSMPFYVAPEQVMKDRAEYARKNIARGRPLVAASCAAGVLLCAENTQTLRKIAEIYDRIAFGGVGRYNELDSLRIAGVRAADLKGYSYSREDVDARGLANQYGQILANVFTHEMKPMEVEILIAEVGASPDTDEIFRIPYDGAIVDEAGFSAIGGEAESIAERLSSTWNTQAELADALKTAVAALAGTDREITPKDLEVAILDRTPERRAFRRIEGDELAGLLG
jgi:proteasome alpha subunit